MKKLISIALALAVMLSMSACGGKAKDASGSTVSETVSEEASKGTEKTSTETVAIGNTITTEFAEMTIEEAGVADDIQTSITTGNITYTSGPDSSADKEFVYIRGTLKNLSKTDITSPKISGTVEVDGYSYQISDSIIESDGSSAFSVSPLITYTYTLYAEVPNELAASFTDCSMNFGFEENFENISVFGNDEYQTPYLYQISITK